MRGLAAGRFAAQIHGDGSFLASSLRFRIGFRILVAKVFIFLLLLLLDVVVDAGSASIEQYRPAIGPEQAAC